MTHGENCTCRTDSDGTKWHCIPEPPQKETPRPAPDPMEEAMEFSKRHALGLQADEIRDLAALLTARDARVREECAKVAESEAALWKRDDPTLLISHAKYDTARKIAAALRSRPEGKGESDGA